MKNCDEAEFGSLALAIDTTPRLCVTSLNSALTLRMISDFCPPSGSETRIGLKTKPSSVPFWLTV
jgi:hypothetical protein